MATQSKRSEILKVIQNISEKELRFSPSKNS